MHSSPALIEVDTPSRQIKKFEVFIFNFFKASLCQLSGRDQHINVHGAPSACNTVSLFLFLYFRSHLSTLLLCHWILIVKPNAHSRFLSLRYGILGFPVAAHSRFLSLIEQCLKRSSVEYSGATWE